MNSRAVLVLDRLILEDGTVWKYAGPLPEAELRAAAEDLVHTAELLRRLETEYDYDPTDE